MYLAMSMSRPASTFICTLNHIASSNASQREASPLQDLGDRFSTILEGRPCFVKSVASRIALRRLAPSGPVGCIWLGGL